MLSCQFCHINQMTSSLTKCCKMFICGLCKEKQEKKANCLCGKIITNKKLCHQNEQIFDILKQYYSNKETQCMRCQQTAMIYCVDCAMLFCNQCNQEMHGKVGFAKHERKKYILKENQKQNLNRIRNKELNCRNHTLPITTVCDCGNFLCLVCLKNHRQTCFKGGKNRLLRQFKEEYFLNVLYKMKQITIFKQKLSEQKNKYQQHFCKQKQLYHSNSQLIIDQFQYIRKMIEVKCNQAKTKMEQYWANCEQVYQSNHSKIQEALVKYDDYAKLIQKFAQNLTNLDYFQKRIKRFYLNFEYCNLKLVNLDVTQTSILGLQLYHKNWDNLNQQNVLNSNLDITQKPQQKEQIRLFGNNLQNSSQLLFQYTQLPTKDRQINLIASHSQLYFNFIHIPYQNVQYQIQYGIGMKIKGQQIFKKLMNSNGYGIIQGLNPSTKYRVRMKVATGNWGEIVEMLTLEMPRFNLQNNTFTKSINQNSFYFIKAGTIYGCNEINFGVHRWIIKLISKGGAYEESETACISIGVSNKQTKKATFLGSTLNYGYQKDETVVKVILDCNERKLLISSSNSNQDEIYQNLPSFPLFPTIQNKGNNQVLVKYSLANDDNTSC